MTLPYDFRIITPYGAKEKAEGASLIGGEAIAGGIINEQGLGR
jgi:hypothetical protein